MKDQQMFPSASPQHVELTRGEPTGKKKHIVGRVRFFGGPFLKAKAGGHVIVEKRTALHGQIYAV